ncbi:MAG TPA: hypothetical protein DCR55_16945 [Lentisphaeria bacterium]|jgi:hypothetical protein|nr:hypothetical protein [Lentisphaeria bacterium]
MRRRFSILELVFAVGVLGVLLAGLAHGAALAIRGSELRALLKYEFEATPIRPGDPLTPTMAFAPGVANLQIAESTPVLAEVMVSR